MRIPLLGLLLLTSTDARAQDAGPFAKRAAMIGVGVGVSIGTVAATDGSIGGILLAPIASALSVYGTGLALRAEGDFRGTLRGAALAAIPGVALVLAGGLLLYSEGCSEVLLCGTGGSDEFLIAGAVLYLLGPPIGAVVGFGSVEPVSGATNLVPGFGPTVRTIGLRMSF